MAKEERTLAELVTEIEKRPEKDQQMIKDIIGVLLKWTSEK